LVIAEGLCLKAPKIKKHTDRLGVEGWDFIDTLASKGKKDTDEEANLKHRAIKPNSTYMDDIIAGRPVFGEPCEPGGFRLRYGRSRTTGLAAAGLNPVSMHALGGFLSVGTQMKIERPGKACAVTPTLSVEGPMVILSDGNFKRIQSEEEWYRVKNEVELIWDAGEILIGFGEFLENNKSLVPSAYNRDWWASELAAKIDMPNKLERLVEILNIDDTEMPGGLPFNGAIKRGGEMPHERERRRRDWDRLFRSVELSWKQSTMISEEFGTAIPPPWNLWWSDLPLASIPTLLAAISASEMDSEKLIIPFMDDIETQNTDERITSIIDRYGPIRFALMSLGIEHRISGKRIIIETGWQPLCDVLAAENQIDGHDTVLEIANRRLSAIREARDLLEAERKRIEQIEIVRTERRISAETEARQQNLGVEETEKIGDEAAAEIEDPGPQNPDELLTSKILIDDDEVEQSPSIVGKMQPQLE
jgi:hypothetical protein